MTTQTDKRSANSTSSNPGSEANHLLNWWQKATIVLFIFLPLLSLTVNAVSWLRFGLDMPFWDDWRGYLNGGIGSFKLSYLFQSACDTLYPVGLILDSLAQRYLDGNSVAYQFLSMVGVLGMLLYWQWRLLNVAIKDRIVAASAFSFTLFMLQPHTYWGEPNLAYHQAIPLVCIMAALHVVLNKTWSDFRNIPLLLILGTVSGLSYISGAFSVLTTGIILLVLGKYILPMERKPLLRGGAVLFVTGIMTSIPQLWVIAVIQKGTHRSDAPMALPIEKDFWLFMLGKVGRALMLPTNHPNLSLALASIVVLVIIALVLWFSRCFVSNKIQTLSQARTAVIFLALSGVIFVYLLLVAAGRTNFRPPELCNSFMNTASGVFIFAFARFHYFWVTLLLPWVFAASVTVLTESKRLLVHNSARYLVVALPIIALPLIINAGGFSHAPFYQDLMKHRSTGIQCLVSAIQKGKGINCPQLYAVDLSSAFIYAKSIGASFTRTIPFLDIPFGSVSPAPLFKLLDYQTKDLDFRNIEIVEKTHEGYNLQPDKDSAIYFETGRPIDLKRCLALKVTAQMNVKETDHAQLYYKIPGQLNFSPAAVQNQSIITANQQVDVTFELVSPTGFTDDLMFVPVTKQQQIYLRDLEVRCLLQSP